LVKIFHSLPLRADNPPPPPNSDLAALPAFPPGSDVNITTWLPSTNTGVFNRTFSNRPHVVLPLCWLP